MSTVRCVVCDRELTGDVDTYGDINEEMCRECFYDAIAKEPAAKSLFGIVAGLTDTEEYLE